MCRLGASPLEERPLERLLSKQEVASVATATNGSNPAVGTNLGQDTRSACSTGSSPVLTTIGRNNNSVVSLGSSPSATTTFGRHNGSAVSQGSSPWTPANFNGVNPRKYGHVVLAKACSEARESSIYGNARSNPCYVGSSPNHPANFASVAQLVTRKSETEYSQDIHIRPEGECGEERVCSFHPSVGKTAEHPSSKNGRSQVRVLNEAPISPKSTIRAWNTSRNKRVAVTFRQHGKSRLELIIPAGCKSQRVVGGSNPSFGTIYGWSQRNRLENTCKYPNEMAETV